MKNPTVATLLNIIPGLGYLYVGQRKLFAALLLVSIALGVISSTFNPALAEYYSAEYNVWDWIGFVSMIVLVPAFMYDAYTEAVRVNKKK